MCSSEKKASRIRPLCPARILRTGGELLILMLLSLPTHAETQLVSVSSTGTEANDSSWKPNVSADGRYIAFQSIASNLVEGDTNGSSDVFVYDRLNGNMERISISSSGSEGNGPSEIGERAISADGRFVAFYSSASNLVPDDSNGQQDIFVRDRRENVTERLNLFSEEASPYGSSHSPTISADGRYVAFVASRSIPTFAEAIFVHDRIYNATERIDVASDGTPSNGVFSREPEISGDGLSVTFWSDATNLVPNDTNERPDVFLRDLAEGSTERVNVSSEGEQANSWNCYSPSLSADGRFVAFQDTADNLVERDTNGRDDIFVHDRHTGVTERVSVNTFGIEGNGWSYNTSISGDGRYVAFQSDASNLVEGDTNGEWGDFPGMASWDVFVHNRASDVTKRVNVREDEAQAHGDGYAYSPVSISGDGHVVAFASQADDLVPNDAKGLVMDVFVHEIAWEGALGAYMSLCGVDDVNGNGSHELAALQKLADGTVEMMVKDSLTGEFISTLKFVEVNGTPTGTTGLNDINGNGSPEIAALFAKADGQGLVKIKDAKTDQWINDIQFFGAEWQVKALTSQDFDGDGVPELSVLAVTDDGNAVGVQIRDAITKEQVNWVSFPASPHFAYISVTSLLDVNGNGTPELAALRKRDDGTLEVIVKDSKTRRWISAFGFGMQELPALGFTATDDIDDNGAPEVALMLKKPNGQAVVQIRDAMTGKWIHEMQFVGRAWDARALTSQDFDGDGVRELSVLAATDDGNAVGVQVRDAITKEPVNWITFPTD